MVHRLILAIVIAAASAGWLLLAQDSAKPFPKAPEQPLPFSHKTHVGVGLKCTECHTSPDPGEMMTFPASSRCMACHIAVAKDKPSIEKLTALAKSKEPIPWVRVYQIPSYVFFSHRAHIEAGAKCVTCHGPVAEREVMAKEKETTMGACMDCHRQNKASLDCSYCHELRQ